MRTRDRDRDRDRDHDRDHDRDRHRDDCGALIYCGRDVLFSFCKNKLARSRSRYLYLFNQRSAVRFGSYSQNAAKCGSSFWSEV